MPLQEELELQGNKLFKYRGTLPLFILIIGIAVFSYYEYIGETFQDRSLNELYKYLCLIVCFIGLMIRILTIGFVSPNTSGRNTGKQVADVVNTTGIYSLIRHPLYVGNFFMWLGPALLTQNVWFVVSFIFIYWVYYERIMFAEEQFLRKKFSDAYLDWAAKVPAFVPNFRNFVKTDRQFSLKKVLKQEKNGFFAIFVIFYLFDAIEDFIRTGAVPYKGNLWLYYFIASGVIYLILKFLKNKTRVLK